VLPGGALYRCNGCGLGFRYPRPPKDELDQLYREGAEEAWSMASGNRIDWMLARESIEKHSQEVPDVLDVGCFDGGFLGGLRSARRFGVEISPAGVARARQCGIEILGEDFKNIDSQLQFDVITAFDVIEHVEEPTGFVESLVKRLRPGGLLIISTGDLDAWSWRISGSRYWYCAIPEHISFVSRRWFTGMADRFGLRAVEMIQFSHDNASTAVRLLEMATNVVYQMAPAMARWLRSRGFGKREVSGKPELLDSPPRWLSARDHLLAVFEKPRN
jgi:SAM-dependent methyltransferase